MFKLKVSRFVQGCTKLDACLFVNSLEGSTQSSSLVLPSPLAKEIRTSIGIFLGPPLKEAKNSNP